MFKTIRRRRKHRSIRWTVGSTIAATAVLLGSPAYAVLVPTLPPFIAFVNTTCSDAGAATGFVSISLGNPDGDEGGARTYAWALYEFDGAIGPLVDAGDVVVENGEASSITAGPVDGGQYVFTAYDVALSDLEVSTDLIITQCPPAPSTTTTTSTTTSTLTSTTSTTTSTTTTSVPTTTIVDPTTSIGALPTTLPPNPTEPPAATGQTLPATGGSPAVAAIAGIVLAGGAVATAAARLRRPRA